MSEELRVRYEPLQAGHRPSHWISYRVEERAREMRREGRDADADLLEQATIALRSQFARILDLCGAIQPRPPERLGVDFSDEYKIKMFDAARRALYGDGE